MKINFKEVGIITRCPFCGHAHEVEVNEMDYWDWEDGMCAQDAFPYLSADEREMLITGICPTCWERTFGGFDDEEEDYETADDAMEQIAIDEAAKVFGGEEPPEEDSVEIFEGSAEDIFHLLFGEEAQW